MLRERCRGVEGFDDFEAIRVGAPDLRAEGYVAEVDAVVNAVRNSAEKREDALFCNVNIDFQKVIRLLLSCFSAALSLWPPSRRGARGGYLRRSPPHGPSRHTARPWHLLLALFFFDADGRRSSRF